MPSPETNTPFVVTPNAAKQFAAARALLDKLVGATAHDGAKASEAVTVAVTPPAKRRGRPPGSGRTERRDPMTTVQPQGQNAPTFESLLAVATDLGTQAGQGTDTQIKFDLKILEGAYLGTLSLDPNKHGQDRRDGIVLAEAYVKAQTGATQFNAKAPAGRKMISNVDKMIRLGSTPKWGQGEPLQNVNALVTFRQGQRKDPAKSKKLDDAHNMLMRYATAQLRSDTLIDGDALKAFAFRREPEERTVEEVLEGIRKTANRLKDGKLPHVAGSDNSAEVQAIINACTKRLTTIAKSRSTSP
jgi:hypothetical protein